MQRGSIDLANEIVVDVNSFSLDHDEQVDVSVTSGKGQMLWVFPTNPPRTQQVTVTTNAMARRP